MTGFGTPYSETEALLYAMEDAEADSGNTEILDAYLAENFLPNELLKLEMAADLLSDRCAHVRRTRRKENHAASNPK